MIRRGPIVLLILLLIPLACIKKVERPSQVDPRDYYPLNTEDIYVYSGKIRTAVTSGQYGRIFTRTYLDSTGDLLMWEDFEATADGIYLLSRTLPNDTIPEISFQPPLPAAPWSRLIGDTLHYTSWEVRSDSVNSHLRTELECEVIGLDSLTIPAGKFYDCIKIRTLYRTIDETSVHPFDGESIYWYAKDVGIVKFETPADSGVLLQATVGDVTYPLN